MNELQQQERIRRWRLLMGGVDNTPLNRDDQKLDADLSLLYNPDESSEGKRGASLRASTPRVARWLGDIREYFPGSVVRIMQKDALQRLNLQQMLLEPEMLSVVEPDVHLVASLISLSQVIPERSKDSARQVVRKLVEELLKKLESPIQQAVRGSLNRAQRNRRPLSNDIDWLRTIKANLKHYQPDYKTIIPEQLIGFGRQHKQSLKEIVLCVDQSGSMASSVVYASIFAAVLASIPAVKTQLVVFDTAIVDLSEQLADPVEVLFGTQLGGGTDINQAVAYCQQKIERPQDTTLVLITDLYEGGNKKELLKRTAKLVASGVTIVTLLALSDDGAPFFDKALASQFSALSVPTFACTPDQFPDLMGTALGGHDIQLWAAQQNLVLQR